MKLFADTARFVSGLVSAEGGVRRFAGGVKREFDALKGALNTVEGKLASIGVSVGAVATVMQSARMDKSLTQIGQTAGASEADVAGLRRELFRMSADTGQNVDDLQQGFNNAVQAGLTFKEALPVIDATNTALAVTGANADSLTSALTVAATAYDFDLKKPGQALELLDKMTVAGRQGNAELEGLSSIFARVAVNASSGGMGFDKTLAFIEGLSQIERQPERLATLADSTLRLFTNANYMKAAAKATKVKFFDADGSRRDALEVLADIKKQYDKLSTDKEQMAFVQKAFGHADLDTIKGMRALFGTDILGKITGEFTDSISGASGTLERDLPNAINNSVDQVGRLKTALRTAADDFVKPINATISNLIKWGMDKKSNGGLELDGKDMLMGGVLGGGALFGAARYGGKAISSLTKRFGGTAAGLAEGKALEAAAGVTPVYVVNMPSSGLSVPVGAGADLLPKGASAGLMRAGVAGGALALGYGLGNTDIGGTIALQVMKFFGSKDAEMALKTMQEESRVGGDIRIKIDQDGRASVASVKSSQPSVRFNVHAGPYMAGQN